MNLANSKIKDKVAVAVTVIPPTVATGGVLLMLSTALRRELEFNGIKLSDQDWSGINDGKVLLAIFDVPDRNSALRVLREVVPQYITGFIELGDFESSEGIWRTVFGTGDKKPVGLFSRFFTDEFLTAGRAYADYESRTADEYFQHKLGKIEAQERGYRIATWLVRAAEQAILAMLSMIGRKEGRK